MTRIGYCFHSDEPSIAQGVHVAFDRAAIPMQTTGDRRDLSRLSFHREKDPDTRSGKDLRDILRIFERHAERLSNRLTTISRARNARGLRKKVLSRTRSNAQLLHVSLRPAIQLHSIRSSDVFKADKLRLPFPSRLPQRLEMRIRGSNRPSRHGKQYQA